MILLALSVFGEGRALASGESAAALSASAKTPFTDRVR
jgi:hypothetical protein